MHQDSLIVQCSICQIYRKMKWPGWIRATGQGPNNVVYFSYFDTVVNQLEATPNFQQKVPPVGKFASFIGIGK